MNEFENQNQNQNQSYNQNYSYTENERNSKLLKGIVIGGVIGGVLTLLDSSTRSSLKETATNLKDTSKSMFTEVKSNPNEVKDQMVSQFQQASNVLKEAIGDAQALYERLNGDLFGKVSEVKDISKEAIDTVMGVKGEVRSIGSKVAEAGTELKSAVPAGGTPGGTSTSAAMAGSTGTYLGEASGSLTGTSSTSSFDTDTTTYGSTVSGATYGDSDTTTPSGSLEDVVGGDANANPDGSGGLGYDNEDGTHTTGGQETPYHDEDEKKNY